LSPSLILDLVGVYLGMRCAKLFYRAVTDFAASWQHRAEEEDAEAGARFEVGEYLHNRALNFAEASVIMFIAGGGVAAIIGICLALLGYRTV
jgi:hypothetical protein